MKAQKKRQLEAAGWSETTVQDLLELSDADMEYIETRHSPGRFLRVLRNRKKLTQTEAAGFIKTSQSRFARMEAGDESVSVDLLLRGIYALGATRKDLAKAV